MVPVRCSDGVPVGCLGNEKLRLLPQGDFGRWLSSANFFSALPSPGYTNRGSGHPSAPRGGLEILCACDQ
jgi:hypothetical protein